MENELHKLLQENQELIKVRKLRPFTFYSASIAFWINCRREIARDGRVDLDSRGIEA